MISFPVSRPKIGIFRALQLGDMLCAIPAIRSLRMAFPKAEIVLIGLPWAASFVQRFNQYIDRFIPFPGYPGLPEQSWSQQAWDQFTASMKEESFDCILQMQGNGTIVNNMLVQLHARQLAGFHTTDCYMESPLFMEYPDYGHEINRHLLLMEHLGITNTGAWLEFPITRTEEAALKKVAPFASSTPYVCVHPGSRGTWRQWPPVAFAALADICAEMGLRVVLTGTQNEKHITSTVQQLMKHGSVDLAGQTSLGTIAALIKKAALLIANCTGVSHIAAAVQTPSLVISMDGEPERWGPLNHDLHRTIDWTTKNSFNYVRKQLKGLLNKSVKGPGLKNISRSLNLSQGPIY
jgi:ADP-heptose:LPS heptosyltransferase